MPDGGGKTPNLTDDVLRLNFLARSLRQQLLDRFAEEKIPAQPETAEVLDPNPIDYLIRKTAETQRAIQECVELIEVKVINKLEGGN